MPHLELAYTPLPYQDAFHEAVERWRIIIGGRRSGKSLAAMHELLRHALTTPDANAWWVSPTLSDAREVGWEMLLEALEPVRHLVEHVNQVRMQIWFRNGSRITLKGAESERALRGRSLTLVVIDEAAYISESIWRKCIRPALSDRHGRAVLCSTPDGRNWLARQWDFAQVRPKAWATFHWPSWINPMLLADDLQDARDSLSEEEWAQEYGAEFVTRAGRVYPGFGAGNAIDPFSPRASEWNVYIALDPGYATHAAVVFFAVRVEDDHVIDGKPEVVQFDELYLTHRDVDEILADIQRVLRRHGLDTTDVQYVYTDPAANAAESTSGISPAAIIRRAGYRVRNRKSEIKPGLALVRSFILRAAGVRRFLVTRNCVETIRSLTNYAYAMGRNGQPLEEPLKDRENDHLADAVRYAFINKFGFHARDEGTLSVRMLGERRVVTSEPVADTLADDGRLPVDLYGEQLMRR